MVDQIVSRARQIVRPDGVLRGGEAGRGPSLLLLHAGGERRQVWTPVIDVLVAAGFRCVAFDLRGHGESDGVARALAPCAADVAAMVREEPPGAVVVGASLGGFAALVALADPAVRARVAGLVLVDTVPDFEPDRVRRFLQQTAQYHARRELAEDICGQIEQLRRITAKLDLPLVLVRGSDSLLRDADVDRLLQLAPHTTVTCIPGAGHLVARDQPVALAEAITTHTATWPARALLRELGAVQLDHPGGALLAHLHRVHDLVTDWGGTRRVRSAALCHAAYGTDGFPHPLLSLDERPRLQATIGDEAEALVYNYGACDRGTTYAHLGATPLPLRNRFTGETVALTGTDLSDFALLTIANELDVARNVPLTPKTRHDIRTLFTALAAYAPDAAVQALADQSMR